MVEAVDRAAASAGLTAPAWMRATVADRLDMSDPADRQPVRRYGGGGPDVHALAALRMQLHMLGGLLVQTAKVSRLAGDPTLHADAEQTLADVRAAIAAVSAWQESTR